jgi:type IV pilus assembly protein PilW
MRHETLRAPRALASRRAMRGVSLVEILVALTLGMIVLAALATFFASTSSARQELERTSRQVENGRFAVELISDDLRLAGFYGEFSMGIAKSGDLPASWPSPCSTDPLLGWVPSMWMPIQAYDNGLGAPGCLPGNLKPGTDVVVVRRVSTCEAGVGTCDPIKPNHAYMQVSKCPTENLATDTVYRLGVIGSTTFEKTNRDCTTRAGLREYMVRMYYIATDNGLGTNIPTLTRQEFTGTEFVTTPLVEGIEELNVEYGIDWDADGIADGYTADPNAYTPATCPVDASSGLSLCDPVRNWSNIVNARVYLLARNIDPSPNWTDSKRYYLGRDVNNGEVVVSPGDAYKRHVYTALVRVVNQAERRDVP